MELVILHFQYTAMLLQSSSNLALIIDSIMIRKCNPMELDMVLTVIYYFSCFQNMLKMQNKKCITSVLCFSCFNMFYL